MYVVTHLNWYWLNCTTNVNVEYSHALTHPAFSVESKPTLRELRGDSSGVQLETLVLQVGWQGDSLEREWWPADYTPGWGLVTLHIPLSIPV